MSGLSDALKQRRSELGYTLAQVADMVGVTEATVQRWESGNIKALRHGRITKLADVLQTTPAYLMGWEDAEATKPFPSGFDLSPDLTPDERGPFFNFLASMDYYTRIDQERCGWHIRKNGSNFDIFMSVEEFKQFVRSSMAMVNALLNTYQHPKD